VLKIAALHRALERIEPDALDLIEQTAANRLDRARRRLLTRRPLTAALPEDPSAMGSRSQRLSKKLTTSESLRRIYERIAILDLLTGTGNAKT